MKLDFIKSILILSTIWAVPAFANYGVIEDNEAYVCENCGTKSRNNGPSKIVVPSQLPANADVALDDREELRSVDDPENARVTFYNPDMNTRMEGGPRNRFGEKINSVEDAIRNGRAVTVAADYKGLFGQECNRRNKRCLVLIHLRGFDKEYPEYRKKFNHLPRNTFVAIVEDTGGAFKWKGGSRFDIAARSRKLARAIPSYIKDRVSYVRLKNPCGHRASGRMCDFSNAGLSKKAEVAMGFSDPST